MNPEELYSFSDKALNLDRIRAFCDQIEDCRNPDDFYLASQKAHWLLCAFWHGCRHQFDHAREVISAALDKAESRF